MGSDELVDLGLCDRIGVRNLETSQVHGAGVDIAVQWLVLHHEARQVTQGRLTKVQRMERQRVREPAWRGGGGVFSGPEGCLERQRRPDVLHDSCVRGHRQRSQESAVFPDRVAEPVNDAVHHVQDRLASRPGREKMTGQF
jgi:hypothetical protein